MLGTIRLGRLSPCEAERAQSATCASELLPKDALFIRRAAASRGSAATSVTLLKPSIASAIPPDDGARGLGLLYQKGVPAKRRWGGPANAALHETPIKYAPSVHPAEI